MTQEYDQRKKTQTVFILTTVGQPNYVVATRDESRALHYVESLPISAAGHTWNNLLLRELK